MADETTRLVARLSRQAGKVHPQDWVELYESHTPFEWAVQVALSRVEPWGDERDDLRAARNTALSIACNRTEALSDQAFRDLFLALANYLTVKEEKPAKVGAKTLRQALGDA